MFSVYLTYFYFMIKLTAFFDTIFFTLSKRWAHVSFLDVCHHLTISLGAYVYVLYAPGLLSMQFDRLSNSTYFMYFCVFVSGGQAILLAYVNCFVNAVMYTYYLIAIFRPSLMLKKNMTRLQIVSFASFEDNVFLTIQMIWSKSDSFHLFPNYFQIQFSILFVHFAHRLVLPIYDCEYPKLMSLFGSAQCLFMLIIFIKFFRQTYGPQKNQEKIQWINILFLKIFCDD